MVKSVSINARECCLKEKERLVKELYACDYDTTSMEERSLCYKWAAKKSGRRHRACMVS